MIAFIIGLLVGGNIGFLIASFCNIARKDKQ